MNRYLIDDYYLDPALRSRLIAQAHRERTRAIRAGLVQLARQARRLLPRFDFRPNHWMERLG